MPEVIFVFAFVVIQPVAGYLSYRRLLARMQQGIPVDRVALYRSTIITQWALFAVGAGLWWWSGRPWMSIGVRMEFDQAFAVGAALTAIAITAFWIQLRSVQKADVKTIERYRAQLGSIAPLIPTNRSELRVFNLVAATAGIVEEFLWRGVLIWFLTQYLPLWVAAIVATVLFGIGHAYQGWNKVPQITVVGGLFVLLFLLTGSLLLPIILHTAVDLFQGRLAYEIVSRVAASPTGEQSAQSV